MTDNNTPWIENTGAVPDGVGPTTVIEVEYRDGVIITWTATLFQSDDPELWTITDSSFDVIRWRFV